MDGHRHAPAALPPGKTRYLLYSRLSGPLGRSGLVRKISPLPRLDTRTLQLVASRYSDSAISAHNMWSVKGKVKMIRQTENGEKKADLCREFYLVNSVIQMVRKSTTKIIGAFQQNGSSLKRFRKSERSDVMRRCFSGLSNTEVTL